jgi:hypothetical protein
MAAYSRVVSTLVMAFIMQFWREMGRNWDGWTAASIFGRSTRKARFILVRSMEPSKKDENTPRTSWETVSQKVAKKDGLKPSGPGLDSLFIVVSAFFISSGVKGALRLPGKGEVLG